MAYPARLAAIHALLAVAASLLGDGDNSSGPA
jgi:hypothetical protein